MRFVWQVVLPRALHLALSYWYEQVQTSIVDADIEIIPTPSSGIVFCSTQFALEHRVLSLATVRDDVSLYFACLISGSSKKGIAFSFRKLPLYETLRDYLHSPVDF